MEFPRTVRTELVISMTLAETFLLLLFVVWFSAIKRPPPSVLEIKVANLQTQVDSLKTQLADEKNKNQDLKKRLDFWEKNFGRGIPGTIEEVKQFCREAGRGYPKCQESNVLVQATVISGQTKMEVVGQSAALSDFFAASGIDRPRVGTVLTDPRAIQIFLSGVSSYYSKGKRAGNRECRFDYRLTYASKEDYYARELFEKYFYAARINQVGITSK